jgi:hypothetical protein
MRTTHHRIAERRGRFLVLSVILAGACARIGYDEIGGPAAGALDASHIEDSASTTPSGGAAASEQDSGAGLEGGALQSSPSDGSPPSDAGAAGSPMDASNGIDAGDSSTTTPAALGNVCSFTNVVIIEGTEPADTAVSQQVVVALMQACGSAVANRSVSQDDPGVLATDGRPLTGSSELIVATGGPGVQRVVAYLEQNDSPVYTQRGGQYRGFDRAAGTEVFGVAANTLTTSHDIAIVEVAYEPTGHTFSLLIYGYNGIGTQAGAFYFSQSIAPNLPRDTSRYYIIEWTDMDGDRLATAADEYRLLASK